MIRWRLVWFVQSCERISFKLLWNSYHSSEKADKKLSNYLAQCKQRAVQPSSYTTHLLPWPWNKNLDNPEVEIIELLICHVSAAVFVFYFMSNYQTLFQQIETMLWKIIMWSKEVSELMNENFLHLSTSIWKKSYQTK